MSIPEYKTEESMDCDGGRAAKKGEQVYISMKDYPFGVLPLANVDINGNLVEFADMVKLPYLHEVRACCRSHLFVGGVEECMAASLFRIRYSPIITLIVI